MRVNDEVNFILIFKLNFLLLLSDEELLKKIRERNANKQSNDPASMNNTHLLAVPV